MAESQDVKLVPTSEALSCKIFVWREMESGVIETHFFKCQDDVILTHQKFNLVSKILVYGSQTAGRPVGL